MTNFLTAFTEKIKWAGLHFGTLKKKRFEPSRALALLLDSSKVKQYYKMDDK